MTSLEIVKLCHKIHQYFKEDEKKFVYEELQVLLQWIQNYMKTDEKEELDEFLFKTITNIVGKQSSLLNDGNISSEDADILNIALKVLKNSFYNSPFNQKLVSERVEFMDPLKNLLKSLICLHLNEDSLETSNSLYRILTKDSRLHRIVLSCITVFINMMVGNSSVRKTNWPFFRPWIKHIVSYPDVEICHLGSALLHQFLVEEELKHEIIEDGSVMFPLLLRAYLNPGDHSCFVLYCLELLLESPTIVSSIWEVLDEQESLLLLDILASTRPEKLKSLSSSTVLFFQNMFKREADVIFKPSEQNCESFKPHVFTRSANFLSIVAASDAFRESLQCNGSLLISTIYLLRWLTDSVELEPQTSQFTSEDGKESEFLDLRTVLVRLIASLVYHHESNQDVVRENNGLMLILRNTQRDKSNPFLQEASILAIRNLLEGNSANQKFISELESRGVVQNDALSDIGLEVHPGENGEVVCKFK